MSGYSEESVCLCALNRTFGYQPGIAAALIEYAGSASAVYGSGKEILGEVLGPYSRYRDALSQKALDEAWKELGEAGKYGIVFIGKGEPGFPEMLSECADCPMGLYVRGESPYESLRGGRDYISIVGTRNVSGYGRDWCRRIVGAIAMSGTDPVIVSGLAYGTDITAHTAALEAGIDTVAVMATGADMIYPAAHAAHAMRISGKSGSALISDYPLHSKAIPVNFIRRNRIIAGISRATILIESGLKGGGMITARQAFSYDRDLYVLPGRADDPMSAGCNALLRSGAAVPVISEKDLAESLGYSFRRAGHKATDSAASMYTGSMDSADVQKIAEILLLIRKNRDITLQELDRKTGYGYRTIAGLTGILENDGLISIDLMQRCSINRKNI